MPRGRRALHAVLSAAAAAASLTWSVARSAPDHDDAYVYRLPYGDAVSYPVLQAYGSKLSHRGSEHFTVDFGMPVGTTVSAAREGVVSGIEDSFTAACWTDSCTRSANFVIVEHADGTTGEYFHLQPGSVLVAPGQHVERGQALAQSGNTGYSTTPHLHFGVYLVDGGGARRSVAVRFGTRDGSIVKPRVGARYTNVHEAGLHDAGVRIANEKRSADGDAGEAFSSGEIDAREVVAGGLRPAR